MKTKLTAAALSLAIMGVGGMFAPQSGALVSAAHAQEAAPEAQAAEIVEMTLGNPDATVEVIEYASYTCSHCANFHNSTFKQLQENYIDTGKIKFTYREVYFDKFGLWASMIARCGGQEKFFGMTDMFYKGQSKWIKAGSEAGIADELRKIGRLAGLDSAQLDACLSDQDQLKALVGWFQANATEHGINSTPSFVINGTKYSNMNYADFSALLDEKLGE